VAPAAPVARSALLEELLQAGEIGSDDDHIEKELTETVIAEDTLTDHAEFTVAGESTDFELPRGGMDLKDHLSTIEVGIIRKALEEADGTIAEAARLLRMRRTTLVEKLRKYRLSA
jgi:DNA-binding NtrC family response regulator